MATALAEKINKDFLKCGICLEPFKNPRGLPCLHSFCEECLEKWAKAKKKGKAKEFACPNCMKLTRIPADGIQGFPAHFLVNSLQETVNMEKVNVDYSTKPCSVCKIPGIHAVIYCYNCQHFLCKTCHDSHSVWEAMKHHKVVSTEDLTSGKASLSGPSEEDDQYCAEHEGEQNKFYCKTCGKLVCRDCIIMKQRCRDHDYETLKEASAERSTKLKELMQKTDEHRKLCQKALDKVDIASSELSKQVVDVKTNLDQVKKEYVKQVENVFTKQGERVDQAYAIWKGKFDKKQSNLSEKLQELKSVYQQGHDLLESASHSCVISRYPFVRKQLEKACSDQNSEETSTIADISIPNVPLHLGQQWKLLREIDVRNTHEYHSSSSSSSSDSETTGPVGIGLTSKNKIAIAYSNRVKVFSGSGKVDHDIDELPSSGDDVAIDMKDRLILIPCECKVMHVYNIDRNIQLSKKFKFTYSCCRALVTIDKNNSVIVSWWLYNPACNKISVYDTDIESEKLSFEVPSIIRSIVASAPGEITFVCDNGNVQTSDYSGKTIRTFQPPPEVITWIPRCVCASKRYEVFVVNEGGPKGIYRYTAGGEYIGCVTTEINDARGIAMSHDDQELYVTEFTNQLVRVFKRP